ncbi:unnamed protein product, partial [Porites evermanni]
EKSRRRSVPGNIHYCSSSALLKADHGIGMTTHNICPHTSRSEAILARAIEVTYDVNLKTPFKAFKQLCCNLVVARFDRILALFPRQTTIQRDTAGDNSTWLAPTAWTSLLNVANWVAKWLYNGIGLPKDINLDAFARRTVTASDSTCPADG